MERQSQRPLGEIGWSGEPGLVGALALLPGALLVLAGMLALVAGAAPVTLAVVAAHLITQFLVLLIFVAVLWSDRTLNGTTRAIWVLAFLFAAPAALPVYVLFRLTTAAAPRAVTVVELVASAST